MTMPTAARGRYRHHREHGRPRRASPSCAWPSLYSPHQEIHCVLRPAPGDLAYGAARHRSRSPSKIRRSRPRDFTITFAVGRGRVEHSKTTAPGREASAAHRERHPTGGAWLRRHDAGGRSGAVPSEAGANGHAGAPGAVLRIDRRIKLAGSLDLLSPSAIPSSSGRAASSAATAAWTAPCSCCSSPRNRLSTRCVVRSSGASERAGRTRRGAGLSVGVLGWGQDRRRGLLMRRSRRPPVSGPGPLPMRSRSR